MSLNTEYIDLINSVAKKNGFDNFELETTGGTQRGDGYMGIVHFVDVNDKDSGRKFELVLKSCLTNPEIRKQMRTREAYLREILLYKDIFPSFLSFQKEIGIKDQFTSVAKFYGCLEMDSREALVLENLRTGNYKLWNRKIPMDSKHIEMVIKEYAKFHAISFAYKSIYPEKFNELTKELKIDIFEDSEFWDGDMLEQMTKNHCKRGYEALGNHPAKECLMKFENHNKDFYLDTIKNQEKLVVLHGDSWCNNMMFSYQDNEHPSNPTKMCFLDFQISKLGNPVLDLCYFMYVCAPKSGLEDLDTYLTMYHEVLSKNLKDAGCDVEILYPMEMLKKDWKTYSKFGLTCAFSLLPFMMSEVEDIPDLTKNVEDGKHVFDAFIKDSVNVNVVDTYNQRLFDLITFLAKNDYL